MKLKIVPIIWTVAFAAAYSFSTVSSPVLKWSKAGCYSSWCETGWYSSPAVADINSDHIPEVIAGGYTINILKGLDGQVIASFNKGSSRIWSGIILADIDKDGKSEIIAASGGKLLVRDFKGDSLWTKTVISNELRGVTAADVDGDGYIELLVTAAQGNPTNAWLYNKNGLLLTGWPQRSGTPGTSAGVFNCNAAIGPLQSNNRQLSIIVPSDVHYICAYNGGGVSLPASTAFGTSKTWGEIGVWADTAAEYRGWGACNGTPVESYRVNFADGAAVIADVNNDGEPEVVVTGNVYDCSTVNYKSLYTGVFIFNANRTRFKKGVYDWTIAPKNLGTPLSEDYNVIESCMPDPVVADLDGDGIKEILFSSYDGRVHAMSLDKTEHDNWPFSVNKAGDPFFRYASPPVVADLDNDGKAEVLFTTWTQKLSNQTGDLFVLDYQGNLLYKVALPAPFGSANWNGGLASPTIDKIDTSGNLGIVINTASSGIVAYDLPGTKNARILWGTGRGNYHRDGNVYDPTITSVLKSADKAETGVIGSGSVMLCSFGKKISSIAIPFVIGSRFTAKVFDAGGRTVPSCLTGNRLKIQSNRSGLFIIMIEGINSHERAMVRVIR
jgi:hypothetical protein